MKGIKALQDLNKVKYFEEYDIYVKSYLGYDEINEIIKTSLQFNSYSERQKNVDMLLLHYAANIPIETLENTDPDIFLQSGLIDAVKGYVENAYHIDLGIDYEESLKKQLGTIMQDLPNIVKKALEEGKEK